MPRGGRIGAVVIGRNEGTRLLACLDSLRNDVDEVVYVDSGSTDGSREAATLRGATVVELDSRRPFTAARARNAGWRTLRRLYPGMALVQFVDGDCRIAADWIRTAAETLRRRPDVAVVCGRRREIAPAASIYNALCDMEWDTPVGEALACGGDALMRLDTLERVGGFRDELIAGEEPELCVRLRRDGARILRVDAEMTLHDAAMTAFGQWWRRARRAGHAYAEVARLHGETREAIWRREARSIALWGLAIPAALVAGVTLTPWAALAALLYPLQALRVAARARRAGRRTVEASLYGVFCVLAKFPQAQGSIEYHARRVAGRPAAIIEYKQAAGPDGALS